jgi:formylglycine-generating enzyme required for sulfatase activity
VNPLLLTVIALVQRYRAQLPERRVELYEEAIEVLLVQWDAVKGLSATAVLQGLELDAGDRRSLLEPVALWMMEQRSREIELDDLRRRLAQPFYAMLKNLRQTEKAVNGFVHLINARSGLLTERGQGIYAFSHLTFQEHLAARAVADRKDYVRYTLKRAGDSWWREVILLEAGYLSTQGKRRVTELIRAIMEHDREPEPYHNLVLAAEALHDVGQARTEGNLANEIQTRLQQAFETPLHKGNNLPALIKRRAAAAEALSKIEGGQFGAQPAFWTLPWGLPIWVEIPAGEFWMGSELGYDREQPVHRLHLERYWISRVPITNAQYHLFVEDAGYHAPRHWEDGKIPRGKENHPVVYVTWHDAVAYCQWLETKLQVRGSKLKVWRATGVEGVNLELGTFNLQLPSEAEWEKAARGAADRREYPWGDEFHEGYGNTDELGVNDTTPVGIFPEGVTPCGVLEMVGNVWGWTRSLWGESFPNPKFKYPYLADDGREDLQAGSEVLRVLRGGSFYCSLNLARCAYRLRLNPNDGGRDLGFRVVVSRA